ncbi:hypothetical protein PR048_016840 [Dryococelus australis]|uniref:RNA-directed DNA polymerase n=1 Tax=Dryococelus australis TaxID=614101 RepID=A0ABQ9H803_9NEOP|nr:hypothetical protein PR048_016840 [Dryococelus australis]
MLIDHVAITRSKLMARSYLWWFGMNDDIEIKVRTCKVCQQVQNRGHKVIKSWPVFLNVLVNVFSRFSIPSIIVSDNGPPFSANRFSAYCQYQDIKVIKIAPYHPQ